LRAGFWALGIAFVTAARGSITDICREALSRPMPLRNAAAARVRLIVWCLDCRHQVRPVCGLATGTV
jgi:hypothetical protein